MRLGGVPQIILLYILLNSQLSYQLCKIQCFSRTQYPLPPFFTLLCSLPFSLPPSSCFFLPLLLWCCSPNIWLLKKEVLEIMFLSKIYPWEFLLAFRTAYTTKPFSRIDYTKFLVFFLANISFSIIYLKINGIVLVRTKFLIFFLANIASVIIYLKINGILLVFTLATKGSTENSSGWCGEPGRGSSYLYQGIFLLEMYSRIIVVVVYVDIINISYIYTIH